MFIKNQLSGSRAIVYENLNVELACDWSAISAISNEFQSITFVEIILICRVDWDTEEEAKGHMSCCTLDELKERIPFLPDIDGNYDDDKDLLDGGTSGGNTNGCSIDLEKRTGKYPPFILKNSNELAYPEGSRTLKFGNYSLNS